MRPASATGFLALLWNVAAACPPPPVEPEPPPPDAAAAPDQGATPDAAPSDVQDPAPPDPPPDPGPTPCLGHPDCSLTARECLCDSEGRPVFERDGSAARTYRLDAAGRRVEETEDSDGDGDIDRHSVSEYDQAGNRTRFAIDSDGDGADDLIVRSTYDEGGRPLDEDRDEDGDGDTDTLLRNRYDLAGRLLLQESFRADASEPVRRTSHRYDTEGRRLSSEYYDAADRDVLRYCVYEPPCEGPYEDCATRCVVEAPGDLVEWEVSVTAIRPAGDRCGLDHELRALVVSRMPNFRFCLTRARERSRRNLSGRALLDLAVSAEGQISDASARAIAGLRQDLADCLAEAALRWRPPACPQGAYRLTVEVTYEPHEHGER